MGSGLYFGTNCRVHYGSLPESVKHFNRFMQVFVWGGRSLRGIPEMEHKWTVLKAKPHAPYAIFAFKSYFSPRGGLFAQGSLCEAV